MNDKEKDRFIIKRIVVLNQFFVWIQDLCIIVETAYWLILIIESYWFLRVEFFIQLLTFVNHAIL